MAGGESGTQPVTQYEADQADRNSGLDSAGQFIGVICGRHKESKGEDHQCHSLSHIVNQKKLEALSFTSYLLPRHLSSLMEKPMVGKASMVKYKH